MKDSIAAILEREYDENPAYREAVDAYTSRSRSTANITGSPVLSASPFAETPGHPPPNPALAPVAGAGLGGGR